MALIDEIMSGDSLTLPAACSLFPGKRDGKLVNPATVFRWAQNGVKVEDGRVIRLEVTRCGRLWMTTKAAVRRFLEAQMMTPTTESVPAASEQPAQHHAADSRRQAEVGRAMQQLAELGVA